MAEVIVLSAEAIHALVDLALNSVVIDGSGHLKFTTVEGDTIDLGSIKAHAGLSGLTNDDHTQYAKADGSRGAFATPAQGTKADNARKNKDIATNNISLSDPTNDIVENVLIVDDGSSTSAWPNRIQFKFQDSHSTRNTSAFNEYGEFRGAPAKHNTVAARWFVNDNPSYTDGTARDATVPIIELMDDRTNRNHLWGVYADGRVKIATGQILTAPVIVLGPSDAIPTGTPTGAVIVRTT
jgi:hypothetical protein